MKVPYKIKPRRLLDDDNPDGYMESDKDFMLNNRCLCVWFLERESGYHPPNLPEDDPRENR